MLHLATGAPPFGALKGVVAMYRMVERSPADFVPHGSPQARLVESVDGLRDFLDCCWRRRPGDRPTAEALLEHPFLKAAPPT